MIELNWDDFYNVVPEFNSDEMKLGTLNIPLDETIDFGTSVGNVSVRGLAYVTNPHSTVHGWPFLPQVAMLAFLVTRRVYALNTYFPLTKMLGKTEQKAFYQLAGEIMRQPNFKITRVVWYEAGHMGVLNVENAWNEKALLKGDAGIVIDSVTPQAAELAFFVACHIAEIFFYRQDILRRLLETRFEIRVATSQEAFEKDGGVAGGCFNAQKRTIQLVLSRLFEGFKGKTPGVAPFLHEFGHLLDHLDVRERRLTKSHGTLPGMRRSEGALYNPMADRLFRKGKALELERYMHLHDNGYHERDVMPIGHPYVFQNDGEFIAGYLEMFFRNPHYFAAQNLDLYDSLRLTFGYDPRKVWAEDFPYYIEQNQKFYREHKPPKDGLSI
jgi:hypothetical protein